MCGTHVCTCVCRRIISVLIAQDFGGQAGADHIHRHILASEQARKEMGSINALQILASAWEGREEAREKLHQSMLEKDVLVDLLICFQTVSTGAIGFQIVSTVSRDRAIGLQIVSTVSRDRARLKQSFETPPREIQSFSNLCSIFFQYVFNLLLIFSKLL